MRWVMTRVLPLPGPASMSNGPSTVSTASVCCWLSPSRMSIFACVKYTPGTTTKSVGLEAGFENPNGVWNSIWSRRDYPAQAGIYLYRSLVEKYRQTLPTCHTEEVSESRDYEESRTCVFNKYYVPWVSHPHHVGMNHDIKWSYFHALWR